MKRIRFSALFITAIMLMEYSSAQVSIDRKTLTGSWLGKIAVGAIELRMVFNININEKDSLIATMDSPDQGAKNIPVGGVLLMGDSLTIKAENLRAEYKGTIVSDTTLHGTWTQGGRSFPLNMRKLKVAFTLNRPQEPKPPFPYISEDITFLNEKFNINLAGTLTIPEGQGPFPAVILITGSGAQNRNEELLGHKPFLIIADYLTRKGIAVLRYDDRGVNKSEGNYATATSADLATDAEAAYNFLKNNPKINSKAIGLIGHSEGGLIAPIVASSNPGIGFIVSLAGPGVTGEQIIMQQNRDISLLSGISEKQLNEGNDINKQLFAVLKKEPDNKKAEEKILSVYKGILLKKKTPPEEADKEAEQFMKTFAAGSYTWLRYFIMTDPSKFWKKVKCPVLALNGEKDLQVNADQNLPAIKKAIESSGNRSVKTMKLSGLNHLFQHCDKGLPSEYGNIEETFSPEALKIISDWITSLKVSQPVSSK
jgi:pimeloyl-ACP methyl ester carboxylesterase